MPNLSYEHAARLIHFLTGLIELFGSSRQILTLIDKLIEIPLPLQQLPDIIVKDDLGLINFLLGEVQFIDVRRVLELLEQLLDFWDADVVVGLGFLPGVSSLLEEDL